MAAMTTQQLKDRLAAYLAAETKILSGQEYTIGDRRMKRADLAEVRAEIKALIAQIDAAEAADGAAATGRSRRMAFGVPL